MSFRFKIIVGITVIQAIILSTIIISAQILMRRALEMEVYQRATTAAALFATTTKDAVLSMDLASLKSFVNEVMKNPDIAYARVLDSNNRLLADDGPQVLLDRPFVQDERLSAIADGVFDTFCEIKEAGINYGRVDVGVSIEAILGDLENARSRIVQIALFEIALSMLLSILLGLYLSRQLHRLKEASERISNGDLGYQIETEGKDEIAITAKAFNQMSLHLRDLLAEIRTKNEKLEEEVNKRHEAEILLQKAYDQLEKRVEERTAELERANEQLKIEMEERLLAERKKQDLEEQLQRSRKMETLGELAGGVAHDLNNVLSGVTSYPELLLLEIDPESSLRKPLETIWRSGKKATAIVQDLLTLARRGVMIKEVLNVNELVGEYLESPEYKNILHNHPQLTINTELAEDLLNIEGSQVHLSKTLMNLVSNAAEAMVDGGMVLLRTENAYLDTPIKGYDDIIQGHYVVLSIVDHGKGISPEDQKRIFEPFFTNKRMGRSSGTGLGLTVVWGTVKDHNGYIEIHSVVGEGSTILLYFPCSRSPVKTTSANSSMDRYHGRGEKILIVDDVDEQLEIASAILAKLGYATVTVSSGEAALEYLSGNDVDLILLDMVMKSGMDGLDTYRAIIATRPGQKAIIASGFSETDRVKKAMALGAGPYIRKPYTIENIGMAVRDTLDGKKTG